MNILINLGDGTFVNVNQIVAILPGKNLKECTVAMVDGRAFDLRDRNSADLARQIAQMHPEQI
jgi:hypothetical protein